MADAVFDIASAPKSEQSLALCELVSGWKDRSLTSQAEGELWRAVLRIASDYLKVRFHYVSEHDREDISQEVMRKLLRGDLPVRDPNSTKAFIHACTKNAAVSFLFRGSRNRERAQTTSLPDECLIADHGTPEPSAEAELAELRSLIRYQLHQLPPHLNETCQAYLDNHLPSMEILASVLEIPAGTVKSRLHEIRTLLRKTLRTVV